MTAKILAPLRFLVDWLVRFIEDDSLASAGYLAYIGLMSLLPFLVFVFTLLGLIGQADQGAGIVDAMFRFMPTEVALTLQEPVEQVVGRASNGASPRKARPIQLDAMKPRSIMPASRRRAFSILACSASRTSISTLLSRSTSAAIELPCDQNVPPCSEVPILM